MSDTALPVETNAGTIGNPDRIITLKKSGETEDWRNALSSLIKKKSPDGTNSIVQSALNTYNVGKNVELFMVDPPPTIRTDNQYAQPLKNLLKSDKHPLFSTIFNSVTAISDWLGESFGTKTDDTGNSQTWNPWVTRTPVWASSNSNVKFDYTFKFAMGQYGLWNAKKEVFDPIVNLMAPTLPQHVNALTMSGPMGTIFDLLSNTIDWETWNTTKDTATDGYKAVKGIIFGNDGNWADKLTNAMNTSLDALSELLENIILNGYSQYTYDISFGSMLTVNKVLMKDSEVSFGAQVDQDGYPVTGSIKISFESLTPPALTAGSQETVALRYGGGNGNQQQI